MNLQQLYYFQKIAECQQYTLAARELHVTQATLSCAISNLERELNVKLFDRKGKVLCLTECGEAYLSCVREALQALARGAQTVKDMTVPARAVIKLSYLESVEHLILGMISNLWAGEREPLIRFDMSHSNAEAIERQLIQREADLGISTAPETEGIDSHLIGYQDNVVIVSKRHPWAALETVSLSDLTGQRFIAYSHDCMIRSYYDGILRSAHVQPEIFAESRFHGSIIDMVSYNMGAAIVPRMKRLQEQPEVRVLSIRDDIPPRGIYLLWARDAVLPPEMEDFRSRITERKDLFRYF